MSMSKSIFASLVVLSSLALADPAPEQLLAAGRADEAISSLQGQLASKPSDAASQNLLCRAYYMTGNWDSGIAACEKAVSLDPKNSQYHLWLGRVYGEKADHSSFITGANLAPKVRREFETAVNLDPKNVEARADLADFYLEAPAIIGGGNDKAEGQAVQMLSTDPAGAAIVRAKLAQKRKDYTQAEKEYRSALEISGGKAGVWLGLAKFYLQRQQYDRMEDAIQHVVSANQQNQHVFIDAADFLIRNKRDIPQAENLLRRYLAGKTVEEAPTFKAHYLLGSLLEKNGNKAAAAQEYRAALSLASNFAPAQTALNHLMREGLESSELLSH